LLDLLDGVADLAAFDAVEPAGQPGQGVEAWSLTAASVLARERRNFIASWRAASVWARLAAIASRS
jgi:hypothetical protein